TDFGSTDKPTVTYRGRHDHVEEVNVVSKQNNGSGHDKNPCDTFKIGIDKDKDREYEVHHDSTPERQCVIVDTGDEISNLFRNVRIPDEHELREPKVSPEYADTKHELSKVMDVARVHILQVSFSFKVKGNHTDCGNTAYKETCKHVPSEECREPMRIK